MSTNNANPSKKQLPIALIAGIVAIIILCCASIFVLGGLYYVFMRPDSSQMVFVNPTPVETADPTIIGVWEDDSLSDHKYDHVVIFRLIDGKYYQTEYYKSDGSSKTTNLSTKVVNDERRFFYNYGDYMIIESNGNLAFYDNQGFIYDIKPVK